MKQGEASGEEVLFGVSLSDVARVHAAERAGVAVEERLAEMGLSRAGFARGEQAWMERLAVSLRDDPGLFVAYDAALAEALAKDGPRLWPYEDDLAAWVSLEGSLQRALDPAEVAGKTGLSLAEVARLHGSWAQKVAEDPKLSEEAARLRAEEPAALVEVRREPRARRAAVVDRAHPPMPAIEPAPAGTDRRAPGPVLAVPEPGRRAPGPVGTETGAIDLGALMKGPLPFDPGAAPGAGAAGGGGTPAPRAPAFTGTAAVDLSQLRAGVPFGPGATPFAAGGTPAAPPPAPPPAAGPAHSSHPGRTDPSSYTGTAEVDVRAILGSGRPMPFQKDAQPAPPTPPAALPPPPPAVSGAAPAPAPDRPRPFDSGTTDVDPALIAKVLAKGAPPFRK